MKCSVQYLSYYSYLIIADVMITDIILEHTAFPLYNNHLKHRKRG
jgi:hypothetical protein